MIAIQKEPFVWKKFFIGLGVPLFLMIIPLILSLYADSMSNWDDDYEYDTIEVELVNGTTYTAAYTLDPSMVIEWCYVCLLYTSPSPRDKRQSRMPSSA